MMKQYNRYFQVLAVWGFMAFPMLAEAAMGDVTSNVRRVLVDDENFGYCMVRLYDSPEGIDCGNTGWVTASCSGDFNPSNIGWRKFETAQIAYATNAPVRVFLDDARKHNDRCFITRIILTEQ